MSEVYITKTAHYLPNEVVSNDEMETYLGKVGEKASKSRRIVLRNNGIQNRYYSIDKDGNTTHTNAELAALAIKRLFSNPAELKEVDLITCGTSSPDQLLPSHAVMVHGLLPESKNAEVVSPSGACCSGMHAFKYAYMDLKLGSSQKAVCTGSERLAQILHADKFELEHTKLAELQDNPFIAFEKDFLRWMLSDGAGAFLMQNSKKEGELALRVDWIEGMSFANEVETCMYHGADKVEDGNLKSYKDYSSQDILEQSIFTMKQDTKLLGDKIVNLGFRNLEKIISKRGFDINEVNYFLPHMSSYFFEDKIANILEESGIPIPKEKWFTNLRDKGNVGAGSIYLMVDELMNSGKLKEGDKILLAVPESARFSYMFSLLTVC